MYNSYNNSYSKINGLYDITLGNSETKSINLYENNFAICNILLTMMINAVPLIQTKWSVIGKQLQIPDSTLNRISDECNVPSKDTWCCVKMLNELVKENKRITLSEFFQVIHTPFVDLAKESSSIEQRVKDITCIDNSSGVQNVSTIPSPPDEVERKFSLMIAKVVRMNNSKVELDLLVDMLAHYRCRVSSERINPEVYEGKNNISSLISSLQDNGYINHADLSWLEFLVKENCCEALQEINKYKEECLAADKIKWSHKPNYKHPNGTFIVAVTKNQPQDVTCKDVTEAKSIVAQMIRVQPTDLITETGAVGSVHFHWRILFSPHVNIKLPSVITSEMNQACTNMGVLQIGILTEQKIEFVAIKDVIVTKGKLIRYINIL